MSKNKISRKLLKKHAEAVKQLPAMALIEIDEESLKPVIDYSKIYETNHEINYGDLFKGRRINFSDPKDSLYLEIPTDLPEDVQDTMEFVRNWASSPTTQGLWLKNEEDTKGFRHKVKMLEIQRKIDNLQKDIASYNTPTKQDKLKELLTQLQAYENAYKFFSNKNTDFNQTVRDMYLRQRASFEAPLYMLDTNEMYGLERNTQSDDPEIEAEYKQNYENLIESINERFKNSEGTRGLGGWSPSAGISIAAYKEKNDLQLNPFHEFGHVGWTGVEDSESSPANKVEQILREEGLYDKPYFIETSRTQRNDGTYNIEGYVEPMDKTHYNNAGREAYNRLMDMRILNNLHPDDRKWNEERVKNELKDNNLIQRYGAKVVARMLNEVAQANPSNLDIQAPEQMYDFDPNEGVDYVKNGKKLLPKHLGGTNGSGVKRLDIESLKRDPEYVNNYNWRINDANIEALLDSLIGRNAGYPQRLATLAMVIPENGGNTTAHGNGAYGLVGWRGDRAVDLPEDFDGQAHKLMVELFANPTGKDWTHGGKGTGVMTGREMYELFNATPNTSQATKAIMKGYVRPESSEHQKRIDFTQLLKRHMK